MTKTIRNVKSCEEQARSDYWMLESEPLIPFGRFDPQSLVGGIVTKVYQEEGRGTILGIVIEESEETDWFLNHKPEKQQHLIIPICPNPEPELNGWMVAQHCHIPIPYKIQFPLKPNVVKKW